MGPLMATVATGTPGGICTVESRNRSPKDPRRRSAPRSPAPACAAITPAKWSGVTGGRNQDLDTPLPGAGGKFHRPQGLRWAEATVDFRNAEFFEDLDGPSTTARSESLPITMPTRGGVSRRARAFWPFSHDILATPLVGPLDGLFNAFAQRVTPRSAPAAVATPFSALDGAGVEYHHIAHALDGFQTNRQPLGIACRRSPRRPRPADRSPAGIRPAARR